jgi:2-polyprenyl-3-methyl-5-hydroxy-6-metoxy-1,4-benzoquinol methylase
MPVKNNRPNTSMSTCPLCAYPAQSYLTLPHTVVRLCTNASCALMFAFPQLNSEQLDAAYRHFYYPASNSEPAPYENTPEAILRHTFAQAGSVFGPLAGKSLLDFGCGVGGLCGIGREYGLKTTGIEPDPFARQQAMKDRALNVYASIDALRAADPEARFDIITMWDVIEHLREPWNELTQLSALLRPGGRLLLSTPNAGSLRARLQKHRWENIVNPTHFYYFTQRSLRLALRRAGISEITEWRFPIPYPGHSRLRRLVHRALLTFHLQGQFLVLAR